MLARKNYRLWSANPFHLSLHFKLIGKPNWSARLGGHYRAVGKFSGDGFLWECIGKHEDYNEWVERSRGLVSILTRRNHAEDRQVVSQHPSFLLDRGV